MINELDTVILTRDIPGHTLRKGEIGAVVHCYQERAAFEVEFVAGDGKTVAVLTLTDEDVRPIISRQTAPGPARDPR